MDIYEKETKQSTQHVYFLSYLSGFICSAVIFMLDFQTILLYIAKPIDKLFWLFKVSTFSFVGGLVFGTIIYFLSKLVSMTIYKSSIKIKLAAYYIIGVVIIYLIAIYLKIFGI
ncbi:MAG: hypothetical protein MR601_06600 [Erysipelotrichaceae bacterium]|nr:hypothetical protein [Erysipelotrichaceae bacterium]